MCLSLKRILLGLPVLGLAACTLYLGGPQPPPTATPVASQVTFVEQAWREAIAQSAGGEVIVIFTQEQLTEFLNLRISSQPQSRLKSVRVILDQATISVYGMLEAADLSASALVVLRPLISDAARLTLEIDTLQVGPLQLPAQSMSALSQALSEVLTGEVASLATGFQVQEVLVAQGQIAIRGVLR
ncbi:MAG: hypothetical protein A2Z30_00785 [Chloroflexi bacterium RBG_16_64_43]|nr:MAG: hypothetical protein A2Z30_00785 [Chloroflexi bacterium RBG_16_64_43]